MSNSELLMQEQISRKLSELVSLLEELRGEGREAEINDQQLQKLLESAIRLYTSKVQKEDEYAIVHKTRPLPSDVQVTQTETAVFVDQVLKQMEIEVFELQMWRSMK